jgi:hypothetical protein
MDSVTFTGQSTCVRSALRHSFKGHSSDFLWAADMEGYNTVYYDPSLSQIFFEDVDYIDNGKNAPGKSGPSADLSQDSSIPGGAIAGIIVAVVVVAIISAAAWFLIRRKDEQRARSKLQSSLERVGSAEPRESKRTSSAP